MSDIQTSRAPLTPPFVLECDARSRRLGGGHCKVCGVMIPKADGTPHLGRYYCGEDCKRLYIIACNSVWPTRAEVFARDGGRCALCDRICASNEWEADHTVALCTVDRAAQDAWRYWTLENLRTLCLDCHTRKLPGDIHRVKATRRELAGQLNLHPLLQEASAGE